MRIDAAQIHIVCLIIRLQPHRMGALSGAFSKFHSYKMADTRHFITGFGFPLPPSCIFSSSSIFPAISAAVRLAWRAAIPQSFGKSDERSIRVGKIDTGPIAHDIAARQARVVGEGPRISALKQAEMSPEDLALCIAIRESVGVYEHSVIPDYMLTMIKHPEIFRCQMEMGTAIFQGRISPRERELAVLRVGWLTQAPYEWGQHVAIAGRYGVSAEEIERVTRGSDADGWSAHERAILRGVEELIGDHALSDATWEVLAQTWDEAQLIEFPMMVGQYVATAYVQNSLRIGLEGNNPGLSRR